MHKVTAIALKELKLLLKDPGGLLLLFALPAMFILVLSIALQGAFASPDSADKIKVLVVDGGHGAFGKNFIKAIDHNGHFATVTAIDGKKATIKASETAVANGAYQLAVFIPDDVEAGLTFKQKREIELLVDPTFSKEATLGLIGAMEKFVNLSMLAGKLVEADKKTEVIDDLSGNLKKLKEGVKKCEESLATLMKRRAMGAPPLRKPKAAGVEKAEAVSANDGGDKIEDATKNDDADAEKTVHLIANSGTVITKRYAYADEKRSTAEPNSVQQNVPGWTIFALFWIAQILSINILHERQSGAFKRVMVAPISFHKYIMAKTLPFVLINLMQAVLMFAFGIFVLPHFGCPQLVIRNLPALTLLTLSISFTAIGFGLLMASLSKTVFLSASISSSVLIIMTALGGIMVPRFVMPQAMQRLSLLVPHGWALEGFLNILVKNQSLTDILPHVGALLLFGAGFFGFAIVRMARLNRV